MYVDLLWIRLAVVALILLACWGVYNWLTVRLWQRLFDELKRIHTRDRLMYMAGARYDPPMDMEEIDPDE
ncbi:MAG: hypothetical protein IT328_06005 [Caldilineaceae bacterium]|nr:hypothetical protein [Caldilineaceae bacterium]